MEPLVTTLLDHLPVCVSPDFRAHFVNKVITVTGVILRYDMIYLHRSGEIGHLYSANLLTI